MPHCGRAGMALSTTTPSHEHRRAWGAAGPRTQLVARGGRRNPDVCDRVQPATVIARRMAIAMRLIASSCVFLRLLASSRPLRLAPGDSVDAIDAMRRKKTQQDDS